MFVLYGVKPEETFYVPLARFTSKTLARQYVSKSVGRKDSLLHNYYDYEIIEDVSDTPINPELK